MPSKPFDLRVHASGCGHAADKRRMTESTVRKNMKVMLQAMYKENDCDRSTVYEPMVKAIQLGATIYTQEQLAKFLSYVAENYMDDSSLDQSFSRYDPPLTCACGSFSICPPCYPWPKCQGVP